jgi:hypothetical protein
VRLPGQEVHNRENDEQRSTAVSLLLALGTPPRAVMEVVGHVLLDGRPTALDGLDDLLR